MNLVRNVLDHRFATALILAMFASTLAAADKRPNVILFLADDLGWNGVRSFGSDFHETPNVDALAAQGVRFTDAYSACTVCSPSRAAIMTGKYPARLHLTDFIAGQAAPYAKLSIPDWTKYLPHSEVTVAEALKAGGYKTAHVGKWHLNPKGRDANRYQPTDHGFDVQVMKPPAKGYFLTRPAGSFQKGDFTTDYFADEASKIIDRWKNERFFLYFAFDVPHTPIQGKQQLVDAFAAKVDSNAIHHNPTYAAMVRSMDDAIGTVLNALQRNGIEDETVVIFTSDNGGLSHKFRKPTGFTNNDPLRRGKGSAYEGGTRVPMVVRWPGVAPAGSICREPVIGNDLYPTVLQLASVSGDASHNADVDGRSLVPLFQDPQARLDREAIYWHYPHYHAGGFALPGEPNNGTYSNGPYSNGPYSAIRAGKWKLIEYFEDDRVELYDLESDVGESNDLASREPRQAAELRSQLQAWRRNVGAQLPQPNPNHDPVKAEPRS
ncbi:sulfatase [Stieleria sp. ICT_E10.1]|uniref:sulfatase n=1 Tax=Stieleria sedimenti TaxID=2976331 RepID=UPI00217F916F|nr:sulfatase [Stieleria sedimenti]MCS7467122.1 sulfatase [Stieleria sedimenti]